MIHLSYYVPPLLLCLYFISSLYIIKSRRAFVPLSRYVYVALERASGSAGSDLHAHAWAGLTKFLFVYTYPFFFYF